MLTPARCCLLCGGPLGWTARLPQHHPRHLDMLLSASAACDCTAGGRLREPADAYLGSLQLKIEM